MVIDRLLDFDKYFYVFGIIQKKLVKQPAPAAKHLAEVIEELSKTYKVIDSELTNYLSIWFDNSDRKGIADQRRMLLGLEGGRITVRMAEARGHCSKIKVIYDRFLKKWLSKKLNRIEYDEISMVFGSMATDDDKVIEAMDDLARWLRDRADVILDFVAREDDDTVLCLVDQRELEKLHEQHILLRDVGQHFEHMQ